MGYYTKPFCFNNHWLNHPRLSEVVHNSWSGSLSSREVVSSLDLKVEQGVIFDAVMEVVFDHFSDHFREPLILVDDTIVNLWTIKAILRGFELASGLQVIFSKSSLIGVNSGHAFLDLSREFLHCENESLPFRYLGLPIGVNPRLASTWDPLVNLLSRRLMSWKHRYMSPWGEVKGVSKISWVNWVDECKLKKLGGLGVCSLRLVNLTFLGKWRWSLLLGATVASVRLCLSGGGFLLGGTYDDFDVCFRYALSLRFGSGSLTSFWKNTWVGDSSLHLRFPRLFQLSEQPFNFVREVGSWDGESWVWELKWRISFLFYYELALFIEFQSVLRNFTPMLIEMSIGGVSQAMRLILCPLPTLACRIMCFPQVALSLLLSLLS
ncbi:unnamed protein product [Vicia faba]|uniref:Uncharacterized protein n=1 Tax=Vicia faba TaxID=3906 RepID=A0AAV0ZAJ8_VICFA|nr:unnamed protein product [Vicia faba]